MAASALVRSAVATSVGAASAAVLLAAHREQVARRPAEGEASGGCPLLRALGLAGAIPAQRDAGPLPATLGPPLAVPEYGV